MAKGGSTTRTQGALTLLIVDDERSLRFSIGEWARDMGYTPLEAPGGREALEAVREHGADAVLLDLRLGDEDGLKLLRQIRESDPDVPVVTNTWAYPPEVMREVLDYDGGRRDFSQAVARYEAAIQISSSSSLPWLNGGAALDEGRPSLRYPRAVAHRERRGVRHPP